MSYDFSAFGGASLRIDGVVQDGLSGTRAVKDLPEKLQLANIPASMESGEYAVAFDIFSFGLQGDLRSDPGAKINNAIYRLELEETGYNSSEFTGTLEYIGLNQINVLVEDTYEGIAAVGKSIVLISNGGTVSVDYLDLSFNGRETLFTVLADTTTHSGVVYLDADYYRVADTVTVTVEDADLNVDNEQADVYNTVYSGNLPNSDTIGIASYRQYSQGDVFGELLSVSIDGSHWKAGCVGVRGLHSTGFALRETGNATGVFAGTFEVPAEYYALGHNAASVTSSYITIDYLDFEDGSGAFTGVSTSAGILPDTGSASLETTPPGQSKETEEAKTEAIPLIDRTVSPSERAPIFNLRTVDLFGNGPDTVPVDRQIQFTADLANAQNKAQEFVYLRHNP